VEHEVSVVSAMDVLQAADAERFEAIPFGVTLEGRWLTPQETRAQLDRPEPLFSKQMAGDVPPLLERGAVFRELSGIDVVLPLVHGVNGEDGTLQGMLEMFDIAYAGCGVEASAIGMDKALQKQLFRQAGLTVAECVTVLAEEWEGAEDGCTREIERKLGYPAFVKPSNGGSSVGVSKARSREDLGDAMRTAFALDRKVLVEEAIAGREIDCGVLGNDAPQASPVGEVVTTHEFYDYESKYLDESARILAPADLPAAVVDEVRARALRAFAAIDGCGFARVDFLLRNDGEVVVNEINTLPGFRPVSMFPRLWAEAGLPYTELVSRVIDLGIERAKERRRRGVRR